MYSYFYHATATQHFPNSASVKVSGVIQSKNKILTMQDYYEAKDLVSKQDDSKQVLYEVVITTLTYLGESSA